MARRGRPRRAWVRAASERWMGMTRGTEAGIAAAAARREAFVRASAFVFIHALRVRFVLHCA